MIRLFERAGFKRVRQSGSHVIMAKHERMAVIPHHNKELKKGLESKLLKILKENNQ